ncbi:citryl-CoA lyase [Nocardioides mesophilus]|uniref:citrate synthase (unknown stereospecificity) n=1 Tax=Nocardioides mesophilus TaxID=433659 RepID=A0A7G9RE24_9ACTN|nr:citryl-CoA lyase [Nocardioides mesophilus]QNN53849.1 citryl-CoA lyase [Nocardioides mesophilus]
MSTPRHSAHAATSTEDTTRWWATAVSDIEPGVIRLRGYPVEQLIGSVSLVDTIWLMLRGDLPTTTQRELLEAALVAAVDHGPQAPSIAAARMAATCGVGLNSAVATGVNLLGDVHGGAGQQCLALLDRLAGHDAVPLEETVAAELADHRARGEHVPGFGHRFHPVDPRRDPLVAAVRAAADAGHVTGRHLAAALELERQLAAGRNRPVPMNIDGATAIVYGELGFDPELSRGLFCLSRSVGILAHAWEERSGGRRIKGPLPPPLLPDYDGPEARDLPSGRMAP